MTNRGIWPENWGLLYAAFAFSQGIGLISYWTLPILAGSLMTGLKLTTTEVGVLGTIEFAGLFVSSLALAPFVDRGLRKRTALVSVLIVISLNLTCALVDMGFTSLAAIRFFAGMGAGLALAIGNATIANAVDTERFSGHMTIMLVAFMVVIMPVFSRVSESYGYQGVFLALAATVSLGALSILFLPDEPSRELAATSSETEVAENTVLLTTAGLMLLAVALLFGVRDTLPWLVAEQLGTDAGMTLPETGDLFSLMYAVSILGPALLLVVSRWLDARMLLAVSMALTGFFCWVFTASDGSRIQFSAGIVIWSTIYFMAFALLNGVAARVDRSGRLVSAVGSSFIAGVTIAPFIGGYLVDNGGYSMMGMAEIALTVLIVLFVFVGLRGSQLRATQ
jgi:predicted MFS family arabinose efflux permease